MCASYTSQLALRARTGLLLARDGIKAHVDVKGGARAAVRHRMGLADREAASRHEQARRSATRSVVEFLLFFLAAELCLQPKEKKMNGDKLTCLAHGARPRP